MDAGHNIDELAPDEYLIRRIKYLQNKVKELRLEIKRSEDLLETYEVSQTPDPQQLKISLPSSNKLDFSVTYWKPRVYQFLFDNPTSFVSEAILLGIDLDKEYQSKEDKKRAIKSISSSLFQLHQEKRVSKHDNEGRRGHKWAVRMVRTTFPEPSAAEWVERKIKEGQ